MNLSKGNNIFTGSGVGSLAPGASNGWSFVIPNNNAAFYLKSILWQFQIFDNATGQNIPLEINATQDYNLAIGTNAATPPAKSFADITMPGTWTFDSGNSFSIQKPGQYLFDKFFCQNELECQINMTNNDLVMTAGYYFSLAIEIELL